jgi:hypothetical protein
MLLLRLLSLKNQPIHILLRTHTDEHIYNISTRVPIRNTHVGVYLIPNVVIRTHSAPPLETTCNFIRSIDLFPILLLLINTIAVHVHVISKLVLSLKKLPRHFRAVGIKLLVLTASSADELPKWLFYIRAHYYVLVHIILH